MPRYRKKKKAIKAVHPKTSNSLLNDAKPSLFSRLKNVFRNSSRRSAFTATIVVLGTAGIGTYLLFFSHADTFGTIRPATATNADGRLEVFSIGANHALYHEWQNTPGGTWSGWESMGGYISSDPAVVRNADGRLEVFVRSNDVLFHKWQTVPGGAWTPNWESLGGSIRNDPAVAMNADGRLEVFANGANQQLYHMWQSVPGGAWSGGWVSIGSGQLTLDPTVIRNPDGRLELFQRGTNGAMYHMWQSVPGGAWSAWTWLGGNIISDIAVGTNADGRLEAFASGTNQQLYHIYQLSPGGAWSGWTSLGGTLISDPAVATNLDGRLELFDIGTNNQLYHQWQATPNGTWSGWSSLSGYLIAEAAVGKNADGHLEVFGRGNTNDLYHNWQTAPNGGAWTGWYSQGQVEQVSSIGSNLGIGGSINVDQALISPSSTYEALLQSDGNFVVRRLSDQTLLWSTGTSGSGSNVMNFQTDGNLVVRPAGGAAAWASGTNTYGGTVLTMQDDGNLVQYNSYGAAVWSWQTGKIRPPAPPTVSLYSYIPANATSAMIASNKAISVYGSAVISAGKQPLLSYSSSNATYCTINGNQVTTNGSIYEPAINQTTAYTFACTGAGGMTSASFTVIVSHLITGAPNSDEAVQLNDINSLRKSLGLKPLIDTECLNDAARLWSERLGYTGFNAATKSPNYPFAHSAYSTQQGGIGRIISLNFCSVGQPGYAPTHGYTLEENLGLQFLTSKGLPCRGVNTDGCSQAIFDAFAAEAHAPPGAEHGHYLNMISPAVTNMGVGEYYDAASGVIYITQEFMGCTPSACTDSTRAGYGY